ncbi:hypothetical protein BDF14DRAFT_1729649 [Spinellus fusiger]|nr:hypothetical protein BDF14DRAFT_1729649 [Spinellus fusiger]
MYGVIENEPLLTLHGQLIQYEDPRQNDCMVPEDFYCLAIEKDTQKTTLLIRRSVGNDSAGFSTHVNDNEWNKEQYCTFETHKMLVDDMARQHAHNYAPSLLASLGGEEVLDIVLCIGKINMAVKL